MVPDPKLGLNDQLAKIRRGAEEKAAEKTAQQTKLSYLNLSTSPVQVDALKLVS